MFNWRESEITLLPIMLIVVATITVVVCYLNRNKSNFWKRMPLMIIAGLMLWLEVVKQTYNIMIGYDLWNLPLHFCSLFLYFCPLAAFLSGKVGSFGRTMVFICGIMFICIFYTEPSSVLSRACDDVFASFATFHTFAYHHLVLLFLFIMLGEGLYEPEKIDFLYAVVGVAGYALVAVPMAFILDTNYCAILEGMMPILERLRLNAGQIVYDLTLFVLGIAGACLVVAVAYLIKLIILYYKPRDEFKKIMKIVKSKKI